MSPPRFRVRTLMVAVAVASVASGYGVLLRRRDDYRRLAAYHAPLGVESPYLYFPCNADLLRTAEWHRRMQQKYEAAARRPWLSVKPDPLETSRPDLPLMPDRDGLPDEESSSRE